MTEFPHFRNTCFLKYKFLITSDVQGILRLSQYSLIPITAILQKHDPKISLFTQTNSILLIQQLPTRNPRTAPSCQCSLQILGPAILHGQVFQLIELPVPKHYSSFSPSPYSLPCTFLNSIPYISSMIELGKIMKYCII